MTPFKRFLWARLLGTAANQMVLVALGWQMYDLTSSAWDLGLVGLLQFLPALVLTIPAGQLVDRVDRRAVMAASLSLMVVVAGVLALGSWGGWVSRELILTLSLVIGSARALQMPAQQAIVPSLVPMSELSRATATSSGINQVAVIGGPALGGFLYATGATTVYSVCAFMMAVSIGFALSIPRRPAPPNQEPVSLSTLFAGVRFIMGHKVVLGALSLDLFAVLLGGATALLPIFAKDVLSTGPWGLGLLRSAPAVGALIVSILLARSPAMRHVGRQMFLAVAVYGVAILVFALSRDFVLSFLALAVSGGADMVSVVIRLTLVQMETPDEMRGRVAAVNSTFIGASNQLGEFRAGAIAASMGAVGSVVLGCVGTLLVVALWMKLFPNLLRRDTLEK